MGETRLIVDELRERVSRFVQMADRIGVPPQELAEDALRHFPPPEQGVAGGRLMADRVAELSNSMGLPRRVVMAGLMLPPGRAGAFEALESTAAFRKRLETKYGRFPSSAPLIREDRDR